MQVFKKYLSIIYLLLIALLGFSIINIVVLPLNHYAQASETLSASNEWNKHLKHDLELIEKEDSYGLSINNQTVLEPEYEAIKVQKKVEGLTLDTFRVKKGGKWGVWVLNVLTDEMVEKYGVNKYRGGFIIEPQYEKLKRFKTVGEGLALAKAKKDGTWGYSHPVGPWRDSFSEAKIVADKLRHKEVDFRKIKKNPNDFSDTKVTFEGEVLGISERNNNTFMRIGYFGNPKPSNALYVIIRDKTKFLENDIVRVYGKIVGTHTYRSQANWTITIPKMRAKYVESSRKNQDWYE